MKYLGVDFGLSHLGFAISNGDIAEPLKIETNYKTNEELFAKTTQVVKMYEVENVVIGVSDGKIGDFAKQFGEKLQDLAGLNVFYQDEDFSTQKAVSQMIESGKSKTERRTMDHNVAAANILQEYLDSINSKL